VKYYVTGAGETLLVEATETGVRIADRKLDAHIDTVAGSTRRHLRIGEHGIPLAARRADDGWVIGIGGRVVRLTIEDERTHAIRELAPGLGAGAPREVRAPMAGLVLRLEVSEGQHVDSGTGLIVIEAMKMENELRAQRSGIVASIAAKEGETVNPGDLLLTFATEDD
jgi:pyruvate carboxylase subunit B